MGFVPRFVPLKLLLGGITLVREVSLLMVGVGGQGVLLASRIIGEAAVESGYDCLQSEVHGMAQRGGVVTSSVKIGCDVGSPLIALGGCDLLVGFELLETYRAAPYIGGGSTVVTSTETIYPFTVNLGLEKYPPPGEILTTLEKQCGKLYKVESTKLAKEAGGVITANIVMLGATVATGVLPIEKDTVKKCLERNVPKKVVSVNLKAFELGYSSVAHVNPL